MLLYGAVREAHSGTDNASPLNSQDLVIVPLLGLLQQALGSLQSFLYLTIIFTVLPGSLKVFNGCQDNGQKKKTKQKERTLPDLGLSAVLVHSIHPHLTVTFQMSSKCLWRPAVNPGIYSILPKSLHQTEPQRQALVFYPQAY